jgi:hypothetical protein
MRARRLAWALWAAAVALVVGALVLGLANRAALYEVPATIITPTFATLGALIVSRRPTNSMGWIFLTTGVLGGVNMFSGQYATVALAPDGPRLPGGSLAAWLALLAQNSFVACLLFLVLLFPNGLLLSRRWRLLAWPMGAFIAITLIIGALSTTPFQDFPSADNPFGIEAATPPEPILAVGELVGGACIVGVMLSLILRFYFSRGEERLQLKWFTYATTVGISTPLLLGSLAPAVFEVLGRLVWTLGFLSIPVSAGVAILKYRLYDIDIIINRTLVYGSLTATLALVYLGIVVLLQRTFVFLTGGGSQLTIVASTLAIAALFNPLRRRIQGFVDRRFYRRKYDARKTLEGFSAGLRDESDLDALGNGLVSVVRETMQPAHVSLWLAPWEGRVER